MASAPIHFTAGTRPRGGLTTDIHTHLAPALTDDQAAGSAIETFGGNYLVDGHAVGPPGLYDPGALVAYLDGCGLDRAAVMIPPPFFRQQLPAAQSRQWVRSANDGLLQAVERRPRLLPLAYLPLEHPDVAAGEYDRVRADSRWAGVVAAAGGRSRPLDDDTLHPLWRSLDEDMRMLLLHPGTSPDPRFGRHYLSNLLGNPVETGVAAAELVLGGVLQDRPGVRVVLVHCGGVLPSVIGRWQRGVDTTRPGLRDLDQGPREAVRRLFVDNLAHDPGVIDLTIDLLGGDKLLLGSDWPFPMGIDDPQTLLAHREPEFCSQVASTNAAAALGGPVQPAAAAGPVP